MTTTDKKFDVCIMRRGQSRLIALNSCLVHGEFTNSASVEYESTIPLKRLADAFSVDDLETMLAYRKGRHNEN